MSITQESQRLGKLQMKEIEIKSGYKGVNVSMYDPNDECDAVKLAKLNGGCGLNYENCKPEQDYYYNYCSNGYDLQRR